MSKKSKEQITRDRIKAGVKISAKEGKGDLIAKEEAYVEFLRKRIKSENYKAAVSAEEFKKEEAKYDKAKLKLKFLRENEKR